MFFVVKSVTHSKDYNVVTSVIEKDSARKAMQYLKTHDRYSLAELERTGREIRNKTKRYISQELICNPYGYETQMDAIRAMDAWWFNRRIGACE